MGTRLILARHGESTVNVIHLASDDHENNPLTALGRQQADKLAADLAAPGAGTIAQVYTSPTQRARETGAVVAARVGAPIAVEWGIEEIRVGVHEGEYGSVARERGTVDFRRWLAEGDLSHGYQDGETGLEVVARASAALRRIAARHEGETVVVISHGGTLAMTLPVLCDNLTHPALHERQLGNCGVAEVEIDAETWTCTGWMGIHPQDFDIESVA